MSGWQNKPFKMEVKEGDRLVLCSCGLSKKGPFCDGAHSREGTGKQPYFITIEEDKTIFICGCCQSSKAPFCDGGHKLLKEK
ncbi:glutamate synthase [Halobacteriovorax marinus]|uniref:Glutamate synthase n=1 Tax=Halobacteriovorax marinus TaxID=97084 RepID=A0A1Y5FEG1_9BACT|nr:glutamate synthase [Halobacteriovorax marinus]